MSPNISEINLRLVSYIVIGLTNQQIAEMLNIPADETIENFLRDLAG